MKRNTAVLGAGYWGKNLIRNFHEIGALKTICDSNEVVAEAYKNQYPQVHFTTSFSDVIADPEITAVAIASPAITHFKIAKAVLNRAIGQEELE